MELLPKNYDQIADITINTLMIDILYNDADIAVIVKPGGFLSVPGKGPENQDCVTSRLKGTFPHCIDQPAVHRLDMDTSGVMVLAFTKEAHRHLSIQFQNRNVAKRYIAIVDGIVSKKKGTIALPFRLDIYNRPRQTYDPIHGKLGISKWINRGVSKNKTQIEFEPITGRTHQLRLHAAHKFGLGYPICGDKLYGNGQKEDQMLLHAVSLSFTHPTTAKSMSFESKPAFSLTEFSL